MIKRTIKYIVVISSSLAALGTLAWGDSFEITQNGNKYAAQMHNEAQLGFNTVLTKAMMESKLLK